MDATLKQLMEIVEKDSVTVRELKDGILHCFCVVNRAFMKEGAMEIQEDTSDRTLDKMMRLLAAEVYVGIGEDFENPTVESLKRLKDELDDRLQLASKDPAIQRKHEEVIGKLLSSVGGAEGGDGGDGRK